jgi:hypothetical protein
MPITQDRMLTLIAEATQWRDQYLAFRRRIDSLVHIAKANPHLLEEFLDDVAFTLHEYHLPSAVAIGIEEHHFRKNAKRNEKARERAAAASYEAKQHIPRRATSRATPPSNIIPPRFTMEELDAMEPKDISLGFTTSEAPEEMLPNRIPLDVPPEPSLPEPTFAGWAGPLPKVPSSERE